MKVVLEVKKFLTDTGKQDYTLNSTSSYVLAERLLGQKFWGISLTANPLQHFEVRFCRKKQQAQNCSFKLNKVISYSPQFHLLIELVWGKKSYL